MLLTYVNVAIMASWVVYGLWTHDSRLAAVSFNGAVGWLLLLKYA